MNGFFARLEARSRVIDSRLCVGLDPRLDDVTEIPAWAKRLIDATAPYAAAFKANSAFYEQHGADGWEVLAAVIDLVPDEIPVILDAKRGDIGPTAEAHARACFAHLGADAVTLSPYLGRDAIDPFLAYDDRGVWVLARTSNPSADAIQNHHDLDLHVAGTAAAWAGPDRLGLVVGATRPQTLAAIRKQVPDHWILAPGVGAQGADPGGLGVGLRSDGSGLLVPLSRAIAEAADPGAAAREIGETLNST